jgi:hypothetical protein
MREIVIKRELDNMNDNKITIYKMISNLGTILDNYPDNIIKPQTQYIKPISYDKYSSQVKTIKKTGGNMEATADVIVFSFC